MKGQGLFNTALFAYTTTKDPTASDRFLSTHKGVSAYKLKVVYVRASIPLLRLLPYMHEGMRLMEGISSS